MVLVPTVISASHPALYGSELTRSGVASRSALTAATVPANGP